MKYTFCCLSTMLLMLLANYSFAQAGDGSRKDTLINSGNAANDARIGRLLKQDVKKKKTAKSLTNYYKELALGYGIMAGGNNKAPFKQNIFWGLMVGRPMFKKRVVREYFFTMDIFSKANKGWFANAIGVQATDIKKIGAGISTNYGAALLAVLANKHKYYITAGPALSFTYFVPPTVKVGSSQTESMINDDIYSFSAGLKASASVFNNWVVAIEYSNLLSKSFTHKRDYQSDITVPMNMSQVRLSVGVRF